MSDPITPDPADEPAPVVPDPAPVSEPEAEPTPVPDPVPAADPEDAPAEPVTPPADEPGPEPEPAPEPAPAGPLPQLGDTVLVQWTEQTWDWDTYTWLSDTAVRPAVVHGIQPGQPDVLGLTVFTPDGRRVTTTGPASLDNPGGWVPRPGTN